MQPLGGQGLPGAYIVHAAPFYPERADMRDWDDGADNRVPHAPAARSRGNSLDVARGTGRHPSPNGAVLGRALGTGSLTAFQDPVEVLPSNDLVAVGAAAEAKAKAGSPCRDAADHAGTTICDTIRSTVFPLVLITAAYGMVPVRLGRPLTASVHPWRSTLLYVVVVQVLVVLSAHSVYCSYRDLLRSEAETAAGVDKRLLAAQSVLHVSSHFILLIVWAELPALRACTRHVREFMDRHGHMVSDFQLRRATRVLPWLSVAFCFVAAPVIIVVWCLHILEGERRFRHMPSHLFQIVFVTNSFCMFAVCCMILRDLASGLAAKLARELSCSSRMTASRLEEFRLTWLSLRHLVADMGAMPVAGLALLGYILLMITLSAYHTVVSFANDYAILFVSSLTLFVLCQGGLIVVCDAAHNLTDVMTTQFYEPLESRSWRGLPNGLLAEYQQFLHTISCSPAEVSLAGTVQIRRPTYLSIMAAITTYLIVLFQLRLSDEQEGIAANATNTPPRLLTD